MLVDRFAEEQRWLDARPTGRTGVTAFGSIADAKRHPAAASGFWGRCRRFQPAEIFAVCAAGMYR
jgi:hypothetical protein